MMEEYIKKTASEFRVVMENFCGLRSGAEKKSYFMLHTDKH